MSSRRRNVSDDPQPNRRRSPRLSADELLLNIPIDLIMDIFSRLPLKSIARCRCVSKRWASVLRRPDFTELFFAKSLARRKLLFACHKESELIFYSSPQPQNLCENVSSIAIDHHITFPIHRLYDICSPVNGLSSPVNGFVCIKDERILKGRKTRELVSVIFNPSTRQSFTLPRMKTRKRTGMRSFLGYDPVEKQHKVLAMTKQDDGGVYEHQVVTIIETRNLTWRRTECGIPHSNPGLNCICISGVLYYAAKASNGEYMIVCFDVRSEKYSFVKAMKSEFPPRTLVDFKGKLGSVTAHPDPYFINGTSTSFEVWILEDPEKHEWSNHVFRLPPVWKDVVVAGEDLFFVGVTTTNEIVLSPDSSSDIFHVYYYNFDKETITRVEILGLGAFERGSRVLTFLNHVEYVKLV